MNEALIRDYLKRAEIRLQSLEFFLEAGDYPDVIREAQEVVELLLKALLRWAGLDIPKVHDVSGVIGRHLESFPEVVRNNFSRIRFISRRLRKEGELAFYGAEDWIPLEEYTREEAEEALSWAREIYALVKEALCT